MTCDGLPCIPPLPGRDAAAHPSPPQRPQPERPPLTVRERSVVSDPVVAEGPAPESLPGTGEDRHRQSALSRLD